VSWGLPVAVERRIAARNRRRGRIFPSAPGEKRAFWLECTERVEGRSLVKGQQKPKQLAKKAAQKTLKEKRQEKKAKKKAGSGFDH
jgi:hypothetical protein